MATILHLTQARTKQQRQHAHMGELTPFEVKQLTRDSERISRFGEACGFWAAVAACLALIVFIVYLPHVI